MRIRADLCLVLLIGAIAGCATQREHYDWGNYDPALYGYYKDPTKAGELAASLSAVIDSAGANHAVVPPGIYAEYGYLLLQQGKSQNAVEMFKQEETRWPESKVFMDRMIKVASAPAVSASASGSGGTP